MAKKKKPRPFSLKVDTERRKKAVKGLDTEKIALEVLKELDDATKFKYYNSVMPPSGFEEHFGISMYIRNKYLWGNPDCDEHPDDVSAYIIERMWELVKEQKVSEAKFNIPKVSSLTGDIIDIPYEIYEKIKYINLALKEKDYKIQIKDNKLIISRHMVHGDVVKDGIQMEDIIVDTSSMDNYETTMNIEIEKLIKQYEEKFSKKFKDSYFNKDKKTLIKNLKDSINSNYDEFSYLDELNF